VGQAWNRSVPKPDGYEWEASFAEVGLVDTPLGSNLVNYVPGNKALHDQIVTNFDRSAMENEPLDLELPITLEYELESNKLP
jgi:hypothetical protein